MDRYPQELLEEREYLKSTLSVIQKELLTEQEKLSDKKRKVIESRRDMWENTGHSGRDFTRLTEMNQYLFEVNHQTGSYYNTLQQVKKYKKIIDKPYFGRFDFKEDGYDLVEPIYVGLHTVIDSATQQVLVYDWRAPISSIFYRYELGLAAYQAPLGLVAGDVQRKRQYKIQRSELVYFFDCNILINDEFLQDILSQNASAKMKNIVETIQKEQDTIIRDRENDLLIVQGVAGSGKTSVALHRIAFLLYDGLKSNLASHNILILSPNALFNKYISQVLPDLGEENVVQTTFDDIAGDFFAGSVQLETRSSHLEAIIQSQTESERNERTDAYQFKGSQAFVTLLERLIRYYEHRLIPFQDVYYNGVVVETRQQLKNRFLNDKIGMPMAIRLARMEKTILDKIHPVQKERLKKLEAIVATSEGHELEIKPFSRLLSMKEAKAFRERLRAFTRIDYHKLYQQLFLQPKLFFSLARGLNLPRDIERIITATAEALKNGQVRYEDCAPLLYLKLRVEGSHLFSDIKQVVIDEAQDYTPIHYEVFKILFKDVKYTVLGDYHQSLERQVDETIYDDVIQILGVAKTIKLFLRKGYRSSYEINRFARHVLGTDEDSLAFQRHEAEPHVVPFPSMGEMDEAVLQEATSFIQQGFSSVAIICKSQMQAEQVYHRLSRKAPLRLIRPHEGTLEKGIQIISAHTAKGLEFDVVLLYGADKKTYGNDFDRRLMYVACTRALHRLHIYHTGEKSPFFPG
ncbi:ATP-binding domain-containing protein [Heliobacterium chlorum]|uniref:DNA 3'-5' helicase n=1 Tax=Heliobacterium chlorum TaxID=2698 RepID=A0ABR7T1R6_HELCL|nr:3'-5' exonuclease [Heliobacterium chlorum]MBC9784072.1 ATP-binding domain-containing protein [Heliobacterium chlorum]